MRTVERQGRSLTNTSARLVQGDRLVATAVGTFSVRRDAIEYSEVEMPAVPPPTDTPSRAIEGAPAHAAMFDWRPAIGAVPFEQGDRAITGGWF